MDLLDDGSLLLLPVAAAETRHRRKNLVNVRARGPDLSVPEAAFDELLSLLRFEMFTFNDFVQVLSLAPLDIFSPSTIHIRTGIDTAYETLYQLLLAPELET